MVFNSLTFIVFFAVLLVLHRLSFSWTTKKVNLLIASYVFYAAWNPPFILLLWASTRFTRACVSLLRERYVWLRPLPVAHPAD